MILGKPIKAIVIPCFFGFLFIGLAATAQGTYLSELIGGESITVGDKVFSDWTYEWYGNSGGDASKIEVLALDDEPFNPGIAFLGNGEWYTAQPGGSYTQFINISYIVTSLGSKIKDNSLQMTDFSINGSAAIWLSEMVVNVLGSPQIATKNVYNDSPYDHREFPPHQALKIYTNGFFLVNETADAELERFEQRFSQVVPEPSTIMLVATGLSGMLAYGFRRRKKS